MIPSRMGRYEIRAELGRGGMATVYRAHDPQMGREVALKVLPREFLHDPSFRYRFQHEAQLVAALEQFPAIVPIYDFGEDNGQPYLVMRLLSHSLADVLAKGPLPVAEASRILSRLAPTLDEAHRLNIVHRDLKPGNILFDQREEPYISDFGIAKLTEASLHLSSTGSVYGTPAYMSPEQAQGEPKLDGRSDIYALGVILFEMLTGKLPYDAATPMGLALKHINDPLPRILDVNPQLPSGCHTVITRAMAKKREQRYSTAQAMATALEKAAADKPARTTRKAKPPGISTGVVPPTDIIKDTLAPTEIIDTPAPVKPPPGRIKPPPPQDLLPPPDVLIPPGSETVPAAPSFPVRTLFVALGLLAALLALVFPYARSFWQENQGAGPSVVDPSLRTPIVPTVSSDPAIASLTAGATRVSEVDGMVMHFVPAGEFLMGTNDSTLPEEKPLHPVYLDAYWIDETEVTNAMFRQFVEELGGYETYAEDAGLAHYYNMTTRTFEPGEGVDWQHPEGPGIHLDESKDNHPVLFVSYYDAQSYCNWAGRRLATEAEWEKAARGTDQRLTPWGEAQITAQHLNFADINLGVDWADFDEDDGYAFTAPVGSYPLGASPYGVLDLEGNVAEWVADAFDEDYYSFSPVENPKGPIGGASYVIRGSSWIANADLVRSVHRSYNAPDDFGPMVGFRCAQSAVE